MPDATQYTRLSDDNAGLFARWNHGLTRLEKQLIVLSTILGIVVFALSIALVKCNGKVHPTPDPNTTTTEAPTSTTSTTPTTPTNITTVPTTTKSTTVAPTTKSTTVEPTTKSTSPPTTTKSTSPPTSTTKTTPKPINATNTPTPEISRNEEMNGTPKAEITTEEPDVYQPILKVQESTTEEATPDL